jgi:hypothetical protein
MSISHKPIQYTLFGILTFATLICLTACGTGSETRKIAREMAETGQDTFYITIPSDMDSGKVMNVIRKALDNQKCDIVENKDGTITGIHNTVEGSSKVIFKINQNKIVMKCVCYNSGESYVPLKMVRNIERDIQTFLYTS